MINEKARKDLVAEMEQRRDELGKRWRQVAQDGGISYETVRAVRKGTGDIPAPTRRALERGLEWPGRYIDDKLGRPDADSGSPERIAKEIGLLPEDKLRELAEALRARRARRQLLLNLLLEDARREESNAERD